MGKIKKILNELEEDLFTGDNPMIEDLNKAEQSINNTRLTEEEILDILVAHLTYLVGHRCKDAEVHYNDIKKTAHAIYSAQTKKLE